jgi:hypothetical protein
VVRGCSTVLRNLMTAHGPVSYFLREQARPDTYWAVAALRALQLIRIHLKQSDDCRIPA